MKFCPCIRYLTLPNKTPQHLAVYKYLISVLVAQELEHGSRFVQGYSHGARQAYHLKAHSGRIQNQAHSQGCWQDSFPWRCWQEATLSSVPHTSLHPADPAWQLASLRVIETTTELRPGGQSLLWYPGLRSIIPSLWPRSLH